jgi:hypothetical protein
MKHLVIALIPTVMGLEAYRTKTYIGASESVNKILELPSLKTKLKDWDYLDDDLVNGGFELVNLLKTNDKPSPFHLTIHEFVLGSFGLLTALFYDEAGRFKKKLVWEFVRG